MSQQQLTGAVAADPQARAHGAQQLASQLAASPPERLPLVREAVRRLCLECVGADRWETRVAASNALAGALVAGPPADLAGVLQLLTVETVKLQDVLRQARPLADAVALEDAQQTAHGLVEERAETLRALRLSSFRGEGGPSDAAEALEVEQANDISAQDHLGVLSAEDVTAGAETQPAKPRGAELASLLVKREREREQAGEAPHAKKRPRQAPGSARQRAQQQARDGALEDKCGEEAVDLRALGDEALWRAAQTPAAVAARAWALLAQHLLSDRWEARHGAAVGLVGLVRRNSPEKTPPALLEDAAVRCLCVLGMDRFGDYASDSVVAPVREACAQLIALSARGTCREPVVGLLVSLVGRLERAKASRATTSAWGRRFAALLAAKYVVAAQGTEAAQPLLATATRVLLDESQQHVDETTRRVVDSAMHNDDVRRAAADVLLAAVPDDARAATEILVRRTGRDAAALARDLWGLLDQLDDALMVSSASILPLAAKVTATAPSCDADALLKSLRRKLAHTAAAVQKAALDALRLLCSAHAAIRARAADWLFPLLDLLLRTGAARARPEADASQRRAAEALHEAARDTWALALGSAAQDPGGQAAHALVSECLSHAEAEEERAVVAEALEALLAHGGDSLRNAFGAALDAAPQSDQGKLVLLLQAAAAALRDKGGPLLDERLLVDPEEGSRDWGARAAAPVRIARSALWHACEALCASFTAIGLAEEATTAHGDIIQAFARRDTAQLDACSNSALSAAAANLARAVVPEWVAALGAPSSREEAREWNASTTAAREHVLARLDSLEEAQELMAVQESALRSACRVFAVAEGAQLEGLVGPLARPLLAPFTKTYTAPVDASLLALLGDALAALLALLLRGGPDRDKARRKLCKSLVRSSATRESAAAFRALASRFPEPALWDVLPEWRALLDNELGRPGAEHDTARAVGILTELAHGGAFQQQGLLKFLGPVVDWAMTAELSQPQQHQHDGIRKGEEEQGTKTAPDLGAVAALLDAAMATPAMAGGAWALLHRGAIEALMGKPDAADAEARRRTLVVLQPLLAKPERCLPFVAGLAVPLMRAMQDPVSEEVRREAGVCFASVVELAPIEAREAAAVIADDDDLALLEQERARGREFLQGLTTGAGAGLSPEASGLDELLARHNIVMRGYQREGVLWLSFLARHALAGALCDDLGLGKTLMSLTQIATIGTPSDVSIVVCPSSLTGHWAQEVHHWFDGTLAAVEYVGTPAERRATLASALGSLRGAGAHTVLVLSYTILARDIGALESLPSCYCVLDEAHVIRNPHSATAAACKTLGRGATHRLALTGTPIHNDVTDMWSMFDFLMPGYLGDLQSFEQRFGKPIRASREDFAQRLKAKAEPEVPAAQGGAADADEGPDGANGDGSGGSGKSRRLARQRRQQQQARLVLEALHRRVLPFVLRRTKEEVLQDLPPKIVQDVILDMSPEQSGLYAQLETASTASLSAAAREASAQRSALGDLTRLMMACSHPMLCLRNLAQHTKGRLERRLVEAKISRVKDKGVRAACKFAALSDLLTNHVLLQRTAAAGDARLEGLAASAAQQEQLQQEQRAPPRHKAIVFAQWKGTLDLVEEQVLRGKLEGKLRHLRLDGDVKPHERQAVVNAFNDEDSVGVLLATTAVGGQGLNLTAADMVVFLESSWNPQEDLQAMDRAHRIGQTRTLNVFRLLTRGTIEEKLLSLQQFKLRIASKVVDASNSDVRAMQTERILDMLAGEQAAEADEDPPAQAQDKAGLAALVGRLDEMWSEDQYGDFDVTAFASALK